MKNKKKFRKLISLIKDTPVALWLMGVMSLILWGGDYLLSKQVYQLIFEVPWQASLLAAGIATLFAILPKLTGLLFAKGRYWIGLLGVLSTLILLAILYFGQGEVLSQRANDPLDALMSGGETVSDVGSSKVHLLATGLLTVLYIFSLFISYLYFSAKRDFLPVAKDLRQNSILRALGAEITLAVGRITRLKSKPRLTAETIVHQNIHELEEKLHRQNIDLARQEVMKEVDMAFLNNAKARAILAIHIAYLTKK